MKMIEKRDRKSLYMALAICGIVLALYNIVIFAVFGASYHEPIFWYSWAMTMIGALSVAVSLLLLGPIRAFLRDWLFGFPIARYGVIFTVVQCILSFIYMLTEDFISPTLVYPSLAVLLGAYLILVIACFLAKDRINNTESETAEKTSFIKELRIDLASLLSCTEDEELKSLLSELTDDAKYSDPVSSDKLADVEYDLRMCVKALSIAIKNGDKEKSTELIKDAKRTLAERNEKCKLLKRSV